MDTKERGEWVLPEDLFASLCVVLAVAEVYGKTDCRKLAVARVSEWVQAHRPDRYAAMLAAAPEPAGVVVTDAMVERANDVWRYYVTSKNLDPWNNSRLLMNVVLRAALRQPTEGEK